ncbi:hypothetical protein HMPREF6745_1452 [Prevotella sp. oral taxon 472 str. F0295]|nr:hypothetical protein HMPREF6745_1452 [Prevotella sp. oral taxon 472 str. F0295]
MKYRWYLEPQPPYPELAYFLIPLHLNPIKTKMPLTPYIKWCK